MLSFSGDDWRKADWIELIHGKSGSSPAGAMARPGHGLYKMSAPYSGGVSDPGVTSLAGGSDPAVTSLVGTDVLWARVQSDGSTLKVWFIKNGTPTDSDWSAIAGSPALSTSSGLSFSGGGIGFTGSTTGETATVDDLTIKSWDSTHSAWVTETVEPFTLDGSGYASDTLTYDNNGNLIYDGTQGYAYDAWNRQITVAHAYNDGSVHSGQTAITCGYDASGRRITKAVANTGSWDATYHYYYSKGYQIVEERNGSDQSIKDHVWGLTYVDEIIQTRINTTPTSTATWSNYYLLQDANFNVQGVTDSSGTLVERYEYGAYGQRQVFTSAGANDPGLYASADASVKVITSGSVTQPYGLNEIGHQGLFHDEASNLVYNRARMLHPVLGRFCQNDPLGYVDGVNSYVTVTNLPTSYTDPWGTFVQLAPVVESIAPVVESITPAIAQGGAATPIAAGFAVAGVVGYGAGTAIDQVLIAPGFAADEAYIESVNNFQHNANAYIQWIKPVNAMTKQNLAMAQLIYAQIAMFLNMTTGTQDPKDPKKCPCKYPINIDTFGMSPREKQDTISYALLTNGWLKLNGPQTVHSPSKEFVSFEGQVRIMRDVANIVIKRERRAQPSLYSPATTKVPGHVPDTCISGNPTPWMWLPMEPTANSAIGREEEKYVGKIVECITVDGKNPASISGP